ncbi:MAG: SprB repeat-containing protein [Haliscomenobacter sp.]|nr:SprB repeat-containing protein [Haliscomenobacter sp.]
MNNLAQGLYTVTVEDANGCTSVKSGAVGGDNCPALSVSGIATDLNCSGGATGAIILTVVGGTTPYFYAWSNGATTADLDELNEGTYSVTVSDANGCTGNYSTTLKAGKSMPKPLYGIVAPDTVCGNEIFTLRADDLFQGPNVTYVWQLPNGEELYSSTPSLKLKATSSAFSGEYSALRDSAGCQSSTFGPVIVDVISLPPIRSVPGEIPPFVMAVRVSPSRHRDLPRGGLVGCLCPTASFCKTPIHPMRRHKTSAQAPIGLFGALPSADVFRLLQTR